MEHIHTAWQKAQKSKIGQFLRLDQLNCLSVPLWPLLWGFLAAESTENYAYIIPAIAFIITLRWLFYSLIELFPDDETQMRSHGHIWSATLGCIITLTLAYVLGGLFLFFFLLWLVAFAVYQMLYRGTWWPHVSHGILFGAWPALLGHAATQDITFSAIWTMLAAFFWVASIEMVRSGTSLDSDKNEHLVIISQLLGELKISYSGAFLGMSLIFLVIAGIFAEASGLYYGLLMLAEAVMLTSLIKTDPEKAALNFYTHSAYASLIIAFAFLTF